MTKKQIFREKWQNYGGILAEFWGPLLLAIIAMMTLTFVGSIHIYTGVVDFQPEYATLIKSMKMGLGIIMLMMAWIAIPIVLHYTIGRYLRKVTIYYNNLAKESK